MISHRVNYFVDLGMLVTFLLVAVTGVMKIRGLLKYLGIEITSWSTISKIHDWSGVALVLFVFFHLILHWRWIWETTKAFFVNSEE